MEYEPRDAWRQMLRVAMNPRMFADQLKASNFRIWTSWALFFN